ncbi:hypothetical protein [Flammeovirga sp. SJP92]|uniref:hypothetical protein n=1 Tax=Flammeovirga sp. SJP92 TaxID=1775430 RepID=UPI000787B19C|nr:hypothetical protein [Flammeovirga sp. SJP92]KXX66840.1 hypothetical protein AVL50_30375 [Flammeovirga sp. SJP92]
MDYNISTNTYLVRLTLEGTPQIDSLVQALNECSSFVNQNHHNLLFIDGSQLACPFDITDKYSIITKLGELGFSRKTQIVVVTSSSHFERNTLETMGYNRGWSINTFKKLHEAKDWIDAYIDINNVENQMKVC